MVGRGVTNLSPTRRLIASIACQTIQEAGDDGGSHQAAMNTAYARWNRDIEREKMRPEGVDDPPKQDLSLGGFTNSLEDPERLAVVFGKLNQQVNNGGFYQWVYNGYKDAAMPYLPDYIGKYRGKYKGIEGLARVFERIDFALEDFDTNLAEYNDDEHGKDALRDKVNDAASEEDWAEVDELLGGTDAFSGRDPVGAYVEIAKDEITVETRQEGEAYIGIVRFDDGPTKRIVARTGLSFATEEEAWEAANNLAEVWPNSRKGRELLKDRAVEMLQEEAEKLANKAAETGGPTAAFEMADGLYDKVGEQVLLDVEDILNTEYAMAGQGDKFIDDAASSEAGKAHVAAFKAKRAVSAATDRYRAERLPTA